jgi:hypothetical protein
MRCPICSFELSLTDSFYRILMRQKGSNLKCSNCRWLLWVPIRGDPVPVPIPVVTSKNFKQEGNMPPRYVLIRYKRNRNHRGEETVPEEKAIVELKKLPRNFRPKLE